MNIFRFAKIELLKDHTLHFPFLAMILLVQAQDIQARSIGHTTCLAYALTYARGRLAAIVSGIMRHRPTVHTHRRAYPAGYWQLGDSMSWSTRSIQRERRRHGSTIRTDGIGVPITNQLRVKPAQRTRYSDGNTDIRYGIRLSDGTSVMSAKTVNEIREDELRASHENLQNHLFDQADRLRRMREMVARQGTLDLPDHW